MVGKDYNLVDIIVVRTANSIIYDPRVKKIISSLCKKYSIIALGWNRDGVSQEKINKYIVKLELFKLKTSVWKPSLMRIFTRLFLFFPPFWMWVLIKLFIYRPKVVHACDLDSILPCYIYKILFRKKLVFDVFDRYAMTFIPKNFRILYSTVNFIEEWFCERSDVLIIANGENVLKTFQKQPTHSEILLNCPESYVTEISGHTSKNEIFTIAFTGHIRKHRGLETQIAVMKDLKDTELVITGRAEDKELLNKLQGLQNVKYLGLLDDSGLLTLEASSDIIVAFYDPAVFSGNMPLPNKLFEGMMCGVPIITNVAHEIVNETGCGIIVEYDNKEQIKEAIITLRDNPQTRRLLGDNGRKAFLEKYNWDIMEKRLYKIYDELLN